MKLLLVCHQVFISTVKVLYQLVVKSLSRYLNTDTEHHLSINNGLFQSRIQYAQMTLSRLFNRVIGLILSSHDFIQMNLVVQKVIKLQSFEWLEHFLNIFLKSLDQCFIFNLDHLLRKRHVLLVHSLGFLLEDDSKHTRFIVFSFNFLRFQVDDLSEQIHSVGSSQHFPQNLAGSLLKIVFQVLDGQVGSHVGAGLGWHLLVCRAVVSRWVV